MIISLLLSCSLLFFPIIASTIDLMKLSPEVYEKKRKIKLEKEISKLDVDSLIDDFQKKIKQFHDADIYNDYLELMVEYEVNLVELYKSRLQEIVKVTENPLSVLEKEDTSIKDMFAMMRSSYLAAISIYDILHLDKLKELMAKDMNWFLKNVYVSDKDILIDSKAKKKYYPYVKKKLTLSPELELFYIELIESFTPIELFNFITFLFKRKYFLNKPTIVFLDELSFVLNKQIEKHPILPKDFNEFLKEYRDLRRELLFIYNKYKHKYIIVDKNGFMLRLNTENKSGIERKDMAAFVEKLKRSLNKIDCIIDKINQYIFNRFQFVEEKEYNFISVYSHDYSKLIFENYKKGGLIGILDTLKSISHFSYKEESKIVRILIAMLENLSFFLYKKKNNLREDLEIIIDKLRYNYPMLLSDFEANKNYKKKMLFLYGIRAQFEVIYLFAKNYLINMEDFICIL